jgi:hypothetical protein
MFVKIHQNSNRCDNLQSKLKFKTSRSNIGFILFLTDMLNTIVDFEIFHNKIKIFLMSHVKVKMNKILIC